MVSGALAHEAGSFSESDSGWRTSGTCCSSAAWRSAATPESVATDTTATRGWAANRRTAERIPVTVKQYMPDGAGGASRRDRRDRLVHLVRGLPVEIGE